MQRAFPRRVPLARRAAEAAAAQPSVARCDTARDFVWRVRNVPWPAETYEVTVEPASREVVLRTTNRKFFKRLRIPELDAARPPLPLTPTALTWQHSGTTLAISYRKPPEVLAAEEAEKQQARAPSLLPVVRPATLTPGMPRSASQRASQRRTATWSASNNSATRCACETADRAVEPYIICACTTHMRDVVMLAAQRAQLHARGA